MSVAAFFFFFGLCGTVIKLATHPGRKTAFDPTAAGMDSKEKALTEIERMEKEAAESRSAGFGWKQWISKGANPQHIAKNVLFP